MSFLTHFYWDTLKVVWFACCKVCINTVWNSDKAAFLLRCNFSAVDRDLLLILSSLPCPFVSYEFNMPHCLQLAGELLARLSLGLYLSIFMFGFVLFYCFPSNRVPWIGCCCDCCLEQICVLPHLSCFLNILTLILMVCLPVQCLHVYGEEGKRFIKDGHRSNNSLLKTGSRG